MCVVESEQAKPQSQTPVPTRPPVDPAVVGLLVLAVVLFLYMIVRYFRVIPWSAR
ncbi:MAG TPA: hypothetical protein VN622_08310 [Clostridia bacterium]|nr:hypothetical protein [Clostridia bacterium]